MNMVMNVYEYGRGGKCVYMLRHIYVGIREMKMQMKQQFRHIGRFMRTSIDCFQEKSPFRRALFEGAPPGLHASLKYKVYSPPIVAMGAVDTRAF